ncbi:tRNA (adenosine(37)-N6)-threonylcarbamoyltransferase complex ATPase subunit type 1 TsaE [soil metagenome]
MEIVFVINAIKEGAANLWEHCKFYKIWAIHGEMGAGKTTFIHALCETLQVHDVISSPTFAIINEYKSPLAGTIYHMDWYRLKDEEEAIHAGIEDSLLSGNVCFIEWPDKAAGLLPDDTLHIYIETLDENTRRLHTETAVAK